VASTLPQRPNLEWLRKSAKERLRALRTEHPGATLAQAQRIVAEQYGFQSWRALKSHVDGLAGSSCGRDDDAVGRFLERAGVGDTDAVRAAIAEDPGIVHAVGPHPFWGGRPQALHVAIEARRREMFDLLLDSGADVDGLNNDYEHWSPLALAIDRDQPDMQRALLGAGARVGLLEALLLGDDAAVGQLLRDGRSPLPAISPNGGSLLAFARTVTAIDRLLELGVDRYQKDRWGASPVEAMSRLGAPGRPLVLHLLACGIPAEPQEHARLGDEAALAALAERDPAVTQSEAVMMGAVDFGHHELVGWLLAHGADPNAHSATGSRGSALHSAAWEGDLRMARLLVAAGADVQARDAEHHNTPAGWARVAVDVTNNPRCAEVADYLESLTSPPAP
jgi:ankyrin repeat protein